MFCSVKTYTFGYLFHMLQQNVFKDKDLIILTLIQHWKELKNDLLQKHEK